MLSLRSRGPQHSGRTLLHAAAWLGNLDVVNYLLQAGANVNAIDSVRRISYIQYTREKERS